MNSDTLEINGSVMTCSWLGHADAMQEITKLGPEGASFHPLVDFLMQNPTPFDESDTCVPNSFSHDNMWEEMHCNGNESLFQHVGEACLCSVDVSPSPQHPLTVEQQGQLDAFLHEFHDVFSVNQSDLGKVTIPGVSHDIHTTAGPPKHHIPVDVTVTMRLTLSMSKLTLCCVMELYARARVNGLLML